MNGSAFLSSIVDTMTIDPSKKANLTISDDLELKKLVYGFGQVETPLDILYTVMLAPVAQSMD